MLRKDVDDSLPQLVGYCADLARECLTWPYLALPGPGMPYLALPGLTWPGNALPGRTWPYLAREVARRVQFDYELRPVSDGKYGVKDNETGEWNGMVGELMRGVSLLPRLL
jgi:hypothetical protein